MEPSSSNKGFIQSQPIIKNQFKEDVSLQRVARLFLPTPLLKEITPSLTRLADDVLTPQIFSWITDAEHSQPYLRGHGGDSFGRPVSELVVTEGWRKLQEFGFTNAIIAINYDTDFGPYNRLVQFLRCHLWEASCANTLCPAAMQDGAARLLQRHLFSSSLSPVERQVFGNAYKHLTSRDPSQTWTSGQWMTERTGGSDVSRTETIATFDPSFSGLASLPENIPLGPWSISGFKWFSSATDSQMTILLAKTSPDKGVSAFFAPMRRHAPSLVPVTGEKGHGTELNGITIQRLKHKFGTQSLPTAELELNNMRGWLVGQEGNGIHEISTILNITRVHTTVSSMGYLGRSLAIARSFALVREVGVGKGRRIPLSSHPLHMRTLANMAVEYHSMMLLVFYTLFILGLDEKGPPSSSSAAVPAPPKELVGPLLRVLSSLHKSYVCETTVPLVYGCMEALGGVGYMQNVESEHINVSRLFRDACVGAIWEGTTDVLASDTLRALKHPKTGGQSLAALDWFVEANLGQAKADDGTAVRKQWAGLKRRVEQGKQEDLLPEARAIAFKLAEVLMGVLFLLDVAVNPGREIETMCDRYLSKKGLAGEPSTKKAAAVLKEDVELDQGIVYGPGKEPTAKVAGSKL
ncbi:hypothetical protein QBC35DRAFT_398800 [Podospora australis]|uniref:Acyl-CoA dehydrogenase n=1 Tax=Podospora australis TaxID=1536484 RepID=A0AAN7ANF0_9PEZI|nr:hypothetical protein QBC35DRAFT_398800 [Podospora australis]